MTHNAGSDPHRELTRQLVQLHRDAGQRSLRKISEAIAEIEDRADQVSHDTIGAMLNGTRVPKWEKLELVVTVLARKSVHHPDVDETVRRFHALWIAADGFARGEVPPPSPTPVLAPKQPSPESERSGTPDNLTWAEDRPFLIIARLCALVIDAAGHNVPTWPGEPLLKPLDASYQQLWRVRPSTVPGEVLIISAANGFALDSKHEGTPELVMWGDIHQAPWQRWRLQRSPDGLAFTIRAVHSGKFLTVNEKTVPDWRPWFEDRSESRSQEWIFAQL